MSLNYYQSLSLERPSGVWGVPSMWTKDLSYMLPGKAQEKGFIMLDITYVGPNVGGDPVIIFDREGKIAYQWPDGYIPGPFEIERVGKRLAASKELET